MELLTECGVCWFAHARGRLGGRVRAGARRARHPDRALVGRGGRGALPVVRRRRSRVGAARARGRGAAGAEGRADARARRRRRAARSSSAASATPDGDAVALDDGRTLEGDRIVWSGGGWLRELFPELVQLRVTRQELFFFDGGPAWRDAPGLGRLRPRDLRHRRPRRPRREGRLGPGGPAAGPRRRPPARDRRRPRRSPAATSPTASPRSPRRRWTGSTTLPLRALRRQPLHRRARTPSTARVWLVGGGSGHGFKHGPAMAERIAAAWDGGAPLPPHFALGERAPGRLVQERGLELLTATNHGPSCRTSAPPISSRQPRRR